MPSTCRTLSNRSGACIGGAMWRLGYKVTKRTTLSRKIAFLTEHLRHSFVGS